MHDDVHNAVINSAVVQRDDPPAIRENVQFRPQTSDLTLSEPRNPRHACLLCRFRLQCKHNSVADWSDDVEGTLPTNWLWWSAGRVVSTVRVLLCRRTLAR